MAQNCVLLDSGFYSVLADGDCRRGVKALPLQSARGECPLSPSRTPHLFSPRIFSPNYHLFTTRLTQSCDILIFVKRDHPFPYSEEHLHIIAKRHIYPDMPFCCSSRTCPIRTAPKARFSSPFRSRRFPRPLSFRPQARSLSREYSCSSRANRYAPSSASPRRRSVPSADTSSA